MAGTSSKLWYFRLGLIWALGTGKKFSVVKLSCTMALEDCNPYPGQERGHNKGGVDWSLVVLELLVIDNLYLFPFWRFFAGAQGILYSKWQLEFRRFLTLHIVVQSAHWRTPDTLHVFNSLSSVLELTAQPENLDAWQGVVVSLLNQDKQLGSCFAEVKAKFHRTLRFWRFLT